MKRNTTISPVVSSRTFQLVAKSEVNTIPTTIICMDNAESAKLIHKPHYFIRFSMYKILLTNRA